MIGKTIIETTIENTHPAGEKHKPKYLNPWKTKPKTLEQKYISIVLTLVKNT